MANAILEYDDEQGKKTFRVRPGQSLLIGASNSSDVKLNHVEHVAPQHCEITFASGTLAIKNLTEGKRTIYVNGQLVNRQRLSDGDQIDIGNNRLHVVLKDREEEATNATPPKANVSVGVVATAAVASQVPISQTDDSSAASANSARTTTSLATPAGPAVAPSNPISSELGNEASGEANDGPEGIQFQILENGCRSIGIPSITASLLPMLLGTEPQWHMAVMINRRQSQQPDFQPDLPNLLAEVKELAAENDVILLIDEDRESIIKSFERFADLNSAILLLNKPEKAIADADAKMFAPWFIGPSNLKFNLSNGTDLLLERVFGWVDLVVIRDQAESCDRCFMVDGTVTDWDSFAHWITGNPNDANR